MKPNYRQERMSRARTKETKKQDKLKRRTEESVKRKAMRDGAAAEPEETKPEIASAQDTSAFELSRIYGQGWNAAKKLIADGRSDVSDTDAATLNPYSAVAERTRWSEGFKQALSSSAKPFRAPGDSGWGRGAHVKKETP